ncbi:hypothetical protein HYFRA_00009515 [Hymenoscyphus fraxineus]|uniref:Uncharacterized protein n=1 Tax=Hymenoscyphus fraxineus TaxID=746836 RepID=A0A9N9KYU7_9HELO|nr:hypothetical protein HYFRA_00009515 [Hymenoscyphus fraxineus]
MKAEWSFRTPRLVKYQFHFIGLSLQPPSPISTSMERLGWRCVMYSSPPSRFPEQDKEAVVDEEMKAEADKPSTQSPLPEEDELDYKMGLHCAEASNRNRDGTKETAGTKKINGTEVAAGTKKMNGTDVAAGKTSSSASH